MSYGESHGNDKSPTYVPAYGDKRSVTWRFLFPMTSSETIFLGVHGSLLFPGIGTWPRVSVKPEGISFSGMFESKSRPSGTGPSSILPNPALAHIDLKPPGQPVQQSIESVPRCCSMRRRVKIPWQDERVWLRTSLCLGRAAVAIEFFSSGSMTSPLWPKGAPWQPILYTSVLLEFLLQQR
ncbi:hypothetical protein LZ31DRAFT_550697 [Colletotrichum somersetense]|nr:hypothetical protein LZ31DRAFT_550697 [Colletotrichum somersetense]